ncbi:hypothetical protein NLG97_g2092 [Lecanicillium saksenae]|uniref:Uncharacterized protein n=1 Tax=Lecanicillium saksenae TaxID=468837 RepID=A0ACC1R4K3_9HYPO|nr:hypothetical protein NLG97_g2092 [Lecanicillium saksenae]
MWSHYLSGQPIIYTKKALHQSAHDMIQKFCRLEASNEAWRNDVATVLSLLVAAPAASNLSLDGGTNVAVKLLSIMQHVRGGLIKFDYFRPLVDAVATDSPDTDIWASIINLVDAVNPSTPPPPSIIPTSRGTPVKTSSSRFDDSETRDIVEHELFYKIEDYTYRGVPGFIEKHFDTTNWTKT